MDELQKEGDPLIIVDAGNMLFKDSKIPEGMSLSWRTKADTIIEVQKKIGIHAANVGLKDLSSGLKYVEETFAQGFPWVSSNLRMPDGQVTNIPAYRLISIKGLKIGIIGVIGEMSIPEKRDFLILNPFPEVKKALDSLKSEGADIVVLLSTMPFLSNKEIAKAIPGINFIINGEDPRSLNLPVREGETVIFASGSEGKQVGVAHIEFTPGRYHFMIDGEKEKIEAHLALLRAQKLSLTKLRQEATLSPESLEELAKMEDEEKAMQSQLAGLDRPSSTLKNELVILLKTIPSRKDIDEILKKIQNKEPK